VIGSDGDLIPSLHTRIIDRLNGLIRGRDRLDGGLKVTGMSDHIGRSKVAHDKLVLARLDRLGDGIGYPLGVHLGLLVVGGYFGGRDHDSFFAGELLFDTSVEEKGDVGVLFSLYQGRGEFKLKRKPVRASVTHSLYRISVVSSSKLTGNMTLLDTLLAQPFGQDIIHTSRRERNVERELCIVPRHRSNVQPFRDLDLHRPIRHSENTNNLPHPIRSVVEAKDRVPLLKPRFRATRDDRLEELVRLARIVSALNESNRIIRLLPLTADQPINGDLDSFPSLITVHSVVPPDNGGNLPNPVVLDESEDLFEIPLGGFGRGVSTITEKVNVDVRDLVGFGDFEELEEVEDVSVDTTVRDLAVGERKARKSMFTFSWAIQPLPTKVNSRDLSSATFLHSPWRAS